MDATAAPGRPQAAPAKTVQQYIDELPVWSDGTTLKSIAHDGNAVAHLVAGGIRKVLRGLSWCSWAA